MKILQQFAAIASHDLQEPLRMVSSYTQLLGQRYAGKLDADADEYITFAIDGANRMQTLIRDLLEYSRVGQGSPHMAMIDSHESLNQALKNLNTLIGERKAKIVTDGLPLLQADATRLTQVFQNLLANAIKFCDPSTTPCITICAEPRERHWFFSVQDNGIGIKSAHVTKIFDVFHRLHNRKAYSRYWDWSRDLQTDCGGAWRTDLGRVQARSRGHLFLYDNQVVRRTMDPNLPRMYERDVLDTSLKSNGHNRIS